MNDDDIRSVAEGLAARGGLTRLLRLLGFDAPAKTSRGVWRLRLPARAVLTGSHATLRLHVIELRTAFDTRELRTIARGVRMDEPLSHHVLVVCEPKRRRVIIACDALNDGIRHMVLEPAAVRHSDIEALGELAAQPGESGTAAALRIHRALDRRRLTARFFRDIRGVRDAVAQGWRGLPSGAAEERNALALLLLSRLMFLYFLQRRGLLNGDPAFLPRLLARWRRRTVSSGRQRTFYRAVLRTLFFGVLNRRPERRTATACSLGELPYLNGGLFEKHRLELRRPDLDLPDDIVASVFDALLEKYRFTAADSGGVAHDDSIGAGIDPEMLGRIFEGLMPGDRRSRTGTFYTPAEAVNALVVETLTVHVANDAGVNADVVRCMLLDEPSGASDRDLRVIADAAARVRVLDPACGSGAFLLGAVAALERLRAGSRHVTAVRQDVIAHSLHGVDLLEDAALICSLRLWLSLIPQCDNSDDVPPLPNLDRRIRQGDALVDPLDIHASRAGRPAGNAAPPELRPLMLRLEPASRAYMSSGPDTRPALRRALASLESRLARAWITTMERQLEHDVRELTARAGDLDLFGAPAAHAATARARLPALLARRSDMRAFRDNLGSARALPFFSFRVHFPETDRFDVVLSNPPWVRSHNWPPAVRQLLRDRYRVCTDAGWPRATAATATPAGAGAQIDLAFLFLERSIRLLRDSGTLGMVLPAKLIRSLAPGGARALLLADMRISSIDDHSLDQRAIFDADAFTAVLVAQRRPAPPDPHAPPPTTDSPATGSLATYSPMTGTPTAVAHEDIRVRMTGPGTDLCFRIAAGNLPLRPGDPRSPWLLAPPACVDAFRAMQGVGTPICDSGLCVRRGAMTGANDVMIVRDVDPKLGDLARIRTDGYHRHTTKGGRRRFAGYVEASALRPILRGTDVQPWRATIARHVLWTPRNVDSAACSPPRLSAFLRRHADAGGQTNGNTGTLHRLSTGMYGHKVVWSDLAADLRAAAVPAIVRDVTGLDVPIVPMNTVYFIASSCERDALLLAAWLNSLPLRTFARTIAERAKDAHFRFFAWTIAMLPIPACWRDGPAAARMLEISHDAHRDGALEPCRRAELDRIAAQAFGLTTSHIESISAFDEWLRAGRTAAETHAVPRTIP